MLLISGNGEIIEPDDGILAIGSGGHLRLLQRVQLDGMRHSLKPKDMAESALEIAADICVFTNRNIIVEEIE